MSKGNGKISAFDFEKAVMSSRKSDGEIEWNGLKIKIRSTVSLKYMLIFVDYVVKACFSNSGEYIPEIMDFAIKSATIKYYTNIELPEDTSKQYKLVYGTDLFEKIFDAEIIDPDQFDTITKSIRNKLNYISNADANRLTYEFENAARGFSELLEQMSGVFAGVDNIDVSAISSAISSGIIDEEKLVNAFVNQKLVNEDTAKKETVETETIELFDESN